MNSRISLAENGDKNIPDGGSHVSNRTVDIQEHRASDTVFTVVMYRNNGSESDEKQGWRGKLRTCKSKEF